MEIGHPYSFTRQPVEIRRLNFSTIRTSIAEACDESKIIVDVLPLGRTDLGHQQRLQESLAGFPL